MKSDISQQQWEALLARVTRLEAEMEYKRDLRHEPSPGPVMDLVNIPEAEKAAKALKSKKK